MNEKSLEKNLLNLERELVNLQTAHNIGLGSVTFWQYSGVAASLYQNVIAYIKINVKAGERLNPIIIFYSDSSKVAQGSLFKSSVYPDRYLFYAIALDFELTYFNWKAVSTSQIEYSQAATAEEAREWLGDY